MERKVVRVEIEYDNGDVERATGEEANSIWKHIEGLFVFQHIHGINYEGPTLKPVAKP